MNNLYGMSMIQKLPVSDFQWNNTITEEDIVKYNKDSDYGFILDVDLEYPKEIHEIHN